MQVIMPLLDLDDVLLPTSSHIYNKYFSALKAMIRAGLPATRTEGMGKLMEIVNRDSNADDHFNRLCRIYGIDDEQRIVTAGVEAYHQKDMEQLVPQKETLLFLEYMVENGLRPAIVTSGIRDKQMQKIRAIGIEDYFSADPDDTRGRVYISPNGKFEIITQALCDWPSDISFIVDDKPSAIADAKRAGVNLAYRMLQGRHMGADYPVGTPQQHMHDYEVRSLKELSDAIKDTLPRFG